MDTDFQPFDSASRPWQAPIPLRRFTLCRRMGKGGSSTAAVKKNELFWDDNHQPHAARRKAIMKAHPEVSKLTGPEWRSKYACLWFVNMVTMLHISIIRWFSLQRHVQPLEASAAHILKALKAEALVPRVELAPARPVGLDHVQHNGAQEGLSCAATGRVKCQAIGGCERSSAHLSQFGQPQRLRKKKSATAPPAEGVQDANTAESNMRGSAAERVLVDKTQNTGRFIVTDQEDEIVAQNIREELAWRDLYASHVGMHSRRRPSNPI